MQKYFDGGRVAKGEGYISYIDLPFLFGPELIIIKIIQTFSFWHPIYA